MKQTNILIFVLLLPLAFSCHRTLVEKDLPQTRTIQAVLEDGAGTKTYLSLTNETVKLIFGAPVTNWLYMLPVYRLPVNIR